MKQGTEPQKVSLARTLGLGALTLYGIGDMLGSGIYALVGKVAGVMGNTLWIAFLISMLCAMLTGLSYASLGSRYPQAAGAAYFTHRAYRYPFLSYMVGLAVLASGLTSMATQAHAFSGYFSGLVSFFPPPILILSFTLLLTFVNFWGIRESMGLNLLCTFVEVMGLLIIIAVGLPHWGEVNYWEIPSSANPEEVLTLPLILQGAVLTFYSFIGFEDMINVIEEVKDPKRVFPKAVVLALLGVTLIYIAVSISAISVVPYSHLSQSKEPLVEVVRYGAPGFPIILFSGIALFAITNTALLNYIMGSRLVYGMAQQGLLPSFLGAVHPSRRTPHRAIGVLMVMVLTLAFGGDLAVLASATSVLLLGVFILVNGALILLKRRPNEPRGFFDVPLIVPVGGILFCTFLLTKAKPEAVKIALLLLTFIAFLYLVLRPKPVAIEKLSELPEERRS